MTQNNQTGCLKKNRYPISSVLIMASFSLVLGCGLQKPYSNNATGTAVKNEKSIEEEVKEKSTTNQQKEMVKEVTKDQLVSFVLSKSLLPKDIDTKELKFSDLREFSGNESQCAFFELASSYVCVDKDFVYTDSSVGGVEWGPHIRNVIPQPHVRVDIVKTDVKVCSASVSVYSWQAPICSGSVAAAIGSCSATSVSGEPTSAGVCGGSIASASLSCGVSLAAMFGMIKSCFGL